MPGSDTPQESSSEATPSLTLAPGEQSASAASEAEADENTDATPDETQEEQEAQETEEPQDTPVKPAEARTAAVRRRFLRIAIFGMVLIVFGLFVLPKVPRSQQLRLHLGIGASRVVSATARVGHGAPGTWDRESTWSFEHGAPATLPWAFDLPSGSAQLEVELSSATGIRTHHVAIELHGDETRVELEDVTRGLE